MPSPLPPLAVGVRVPERRHISDAHARLAAVLDTVQAEFDLVQGDLTASRADKEEVQALAASQAQEVGEMHRLLAQLETRHATLEAQYVPCLPPPMCACACGAPRIRRPRRPVPLRRRLPRPRPVRPPHRAPG